VAAPAALHQPPQRLGEVALGHDVIGERVEDLVGVERRDRLRSIPAGVARCAGEERVAAGDPPAGGPQVTRIRREAGHRR
jgi:hypothetical protein